MSVRYCVCVCYEPEWFLGKDTRGVARYYPPIIDRRYDRQSEDHSDYSLAFQYAEELGREIAICDFEKGIGGRCAALFEYDGTCETVHVFDKNGKHKRLEHPPYYPYVNDPLMDDRGDG